MPPGQAGSQGPRAWPLLGGWGGPPRPAGEEFLSKRFCLPGVPVSQSFAERKWAVLGPLCIHASRRFGVASFFSNQYWIQEANKQTENPKALTALSYLGSQSP